jgi:hypothetical protein
VAGRETDWKLDAGGSGADMETWEKDPTSPLSYRPIALTSHVCTLMERMIMERHTYFLERRGLMSPDQSGFRKGRGTMDPVLCLESVIRKA